MLYVITYMYTMHGYIAISYIATYVNSQLPYWDIQAMYSYVCKLFIATNVRKLFIATNVKLWLASGVWLYVGS